MNSPLHRAFLLLPFGGVPVRVEPLNFWVVVLLPEVYIKIRPHNRSKVKVTDLPTVLSKGFLGGAIVVLIISLLGGAMVELSEAVGILLAGVLGAGLPYLWQSSKRSGDRD